MHVVTEEGLELFNRAEFGDVSCGRVALGFDHDVEIIVVGAKNVVVVLCTGRRIRLRIPPG